MYTYFSKHLHVNFLKSVTGILLYCNTFYYQSWVHSIFHDLWIYIFCNVNLLTAKLDFYQTWLYVTRRVSNTGTASLRQLLDSPPDFWWVCVAHLFSFLCCVFCFVFLRTVLPVSLDCPFLIAPTPSISNKINILGQTSITWLSGYLFLKKLFSSFY